MNWVDIRDLSGLLPVVDVARGFTSALFLLKLSSVQCKAAPRK